MSNFYALISLTAMVLGTVLSIRAGCVSTRKDRTVGTIFVPFLFGCLFFLLGFGLAIREIFRGVNVELGSHIALVVIAGGSVVAASIALGMVIGHSANKASAKRFQRSQPRLTTIPRNFDL